MRARDVMIVGVALICCIIGWSQEGSLSFQKAFKIPISVQREGLRIPPKPLVIDIGGNNHPYLIATPNAYSVALYETFYARRNLENVFVPMKSKADVNFYSSVIGLGAGVLVPKETAHVVAVLTDDYKVALFNISDGTSFQRMWESEVAPSGSWVRVHHAAISIVPERIDRTDIGIVVVAVKAADASGAVLTLFAAFDGGLGEVRWRYFSDAKNELDDVLREANESSPLAVDELTNLFNLPPGTEDQGGAAEAETSGDKAIRYVDSRTYEKPWTTYREAVIAALPHHYAHPWDAQLRPHRLYPAKSRKKQRKAHPGAKVTLLRESGIVRMEQEDYGVLGEKMDLWNERNSLRAPPKNSPNNKEVSRKPANAFVYHSRHGVEVVHMFTGNTITSVVPLRSHNTYYHDINDDFHIESISTQIGPRVATHSAHGVDLLADCLGLIRTGIPISEDEVYNATICDTQGFFGNLDLIHHFVDGDIRGEEAPHTLNTLELLGSQNIVSKTTRSVMPLVVQTHVSKGTGLFQVERYAVFMIDSGLVTCVDPSRRRVLWRVQTDATFSDLATLRDIEAEFTYFQDDEKESRCQPYPHLAPYSLYQRSVEDDVHYVGGGRRRYRRTEPYILAVGENALTVINTKNGKVARTITLDEAPVAPVIISDFNGDGTNDVIVVTQTHIYGFVGNTQVSSETLTVLMILLVALLVILFLAREVTIRSDDNVEEYACTTGPITSSGKVFKRATD